MSESMKSLLIDLADLVERHRAGFSYTVDDDGIWLTIGEICQESICIGFPDGGDASYIRSLVALEQP